MSADVTQSDIDAIDARIAELAALAVATGGQLRSLNVQSTSARFSLSYHEIALAGCLAADKFNLWRGGVVTLLPVLAGVFVFIALDVITSLRLFSIISGALCGTLSAIVSYLALFHTSAEEASRRRDQARRKLAGLKRQLKELKHRQRSTASDKASAETRSAEIAAQLEHLNKIRSIEYKQEKMFQLNWKAMRSIEFEQYLKEVLQLLGYDIETTATSGDQGVDLIASRYGVRIAIQVKGYHHSVGNSAVQEAYSGMAHYQCQRCAVITNSRFTTGAVQLAQSTGCVLIHEGIFRDFVMGHLDLVNMTHQTVT